MPQHVPQRGAGGSTDPFETPLPRGRLLGSRQGQGRSAGAGSSAAASPRSLGGAVARGGSVAPSLFGSMASKSEPDDMASYYTVLEDQEAADERERTVKRLRVALTVLCGVQTACAACFLATITAVPEGIEARLLVMTVAVTAATGVVGMYGAYKQVEPALQWFVISQIWCLSNIIAQYVRDQQTTCVRIAPAPATLYTRAMVTPNSVLFIPSSNKNLTPNPVLFTLS